jgi:nucleoside-diphosphate-sugar epimerase
MKKVLITGANSYVGINVEKWLMKEPDKYFVETLDMKNPNWMYFDFSKFDVVFHVAGIAHKKIRKKHRDIYYKINYKLTLEVAKKASISGVKQFIFMSSMAVYGKKRGVINVSTTPNSKSDYGLSKLMAEKDLQEKYSDQMTISLVRPPLIYGFKSPGNFRKLSKFIKRLRIISSYYNERSMVFIDNFSNFIKIILDKNLKGIFHPQNNQYVSTMDSCRVILEVNNLRYIKLNILNPLISFFSYNLLSKIFGDLYYSKELSDFDLEYNIVDFKSSIINSEGILL